MKNFRGRIIRLDENDYIVEESDSETDSEVGAVFDDEELQTVFGPGGPGGNPFGGLGFGLGLGLVGLPFYSDSESEDLEEGDLVEREELFSIGTEDTSSEDGSVDLPLLEVDDLFAPIAGAITNNHLSEVGGEVEDVSLEGYFAFGGERRRASATSLASRSRSGSGGLEPGVFAGPSSRSRSPGVVGVVPSASMSTSSSTSGLVSSGLSTTGLLQGLSEPTTTTGEGEEAGLQQVVRIRRPRSTVVIHHLTMNEADGAVDELGRIADSEINSDGRVEENGTQSSEASSSVEYFDNKEEESIGRSVNEDKEEMVENKEDDDSSSAKRKKLSLLEVEDVNIIGCSSSVGGDGETGPASEESGRTPEIDADAEGDVTCNPMVSDMEELDENDDALRGDRIGSTTYSERHVLKILMKWVQELPKYSEEKNEDLDSETVANNDVKNSPVDSVDRARFLDSDFEEEMALLWDMSFEPDVMNFLVQHNAFNIIRETLSVSRCDRLIEIGLGIMANIISQQSIVEDFSIHDASLKLVEGVVLLAQKMPCVPVLTQVFSVMRRITWFLRNVALVPKWMELFLSHEFLNCANFILSSSTNALLLGNVIVSLFCILEALSPDLADKEEEENGTGGGGDGDMIEREPAYGSSFFGKVLEEKKKDFDHYRPFCETKFVPSLCEGLNELLKNPKPRKVQEMTSTHENIRPLGDDATEERTLDDLEITIPEGLVQTALLNGLSSFVYMYKTPNGKQTIREHYSPVFVFLLNLLRKFALCTDSTDRSTTLDYFSLGLSLLSFCHKQEDCLSKEGLKVPLVTASQLMADEEEDEELRTLQQKNGIPHDSKTFIALVLHEYYASLADNFGLEGITQFKTDLVTSSEENRSSSATKYKKFLDTLDTLVAAQVQVQVSEESSSSVQNSA